MIREGDNISGHVLQRTLGQGPFGTSWLAEAGGAPVRLKLLQPEFVARPEGLAGFQRLAAAVQFHTALQHHYVARPYGVVSVPDRYAHGMASEWVHGYPLDELSVSAAAREADDPTELARLLFFFEELGDTIQWLHDQQIVHGNLKPSNVLVQRGDFGLVPKLVDLSWSAIGVAALPNSPISPEQYAGQVPGPASDQWAFGALMTDRLSRDEGGFGGLPEHLVQAVLRMGSDRPQDRFGSMREAVAVLRSVRSELERARVLVGARRNREDSRLASPPVPTARRLDGRGRPPVATPLALPPRSAPFEPAGPSGMSTGDLAEAPTQAGRAIPPEPDLSDEATQPHRPLQRTPHRVAPAALAEGDLEVSEQGRLPHDSEPAIVLKPQAPRRFAAAAAALLLVGAAGWWLSSGTQAPSRGGPTEVASAPEAPGSVSPGPVSPGASASLQTEPDPGAEADSGDATPARTESESDRAGSRPPLPPEPEPSAGTADAEGPPGKVACSRGEVDGCERWGAWATDQGRVYDARTAYDRGCRAGSPEACVEAMRWWTGAPSEGAEAKALGYLEDGCELGGAEACHLAAGFHRSGTAGEVDTEAADRLEARACALGRVASCRRGAGAKTDTPSMAAR